MAGRRRDTPGQPTQRAARGDRRQVRLAERLGRAQTAPQQLAAAYDYAPEVDNAHGDEPPRGWSGWWRHLAGELTPPEAWQHRPPAPAELLRYAHKGEWTAPTGARRTAGIWWCRLIALPATVLTGYLAWMTARPSRTAVVVGLWAVLMHVPLVRTAAGWLLPFDPWPTWLP